MARKKRNLAKLTSQAVMTSLQNVFRTTSRMSPKLAGWLAVNIFLRPRKHHRPSQEKTLLKSARQFWLDTEFGKMAAWTWGEGPVVLLVHGWEGRGSQLGAFVAPLVERGYQVVTFDAPAHGESDGSKTNLLRIASVIADLVKLFGPIHALIAHSLGGAASGLSLKAGAAVERVVYLAVPNDAVNITHQFADIMGLSRKAVAKMREYILKRFRPDWKGFANSWEELTQSSYAGKLAAPLLIFHDQGDRTIPIKEGQAIARAWPGAELVATNGLGHYKILSDPQVVSRAVAFILRDLKKIKYP